MLTFYMCKLFRGHAQIIFPMSADAINNCRYLTQPKNYFKSFGNIRDFPKLRRPKLSRSTQ